MIGQAIVGNRSSTRGSVWLTASFLILVSGSVAIASGRGARSKTTVSRNSYEGQELFVKVWEPGKPSPIGGDGLGPLYNEKSCVGCHNLGGTGGAGGGDRNVLMVTAIAKPAAEVVAGRVFHGNLKDLHPGLRSGASPVIHHHATIESFDDRLRNIRDYTMVDGRGSDFKLKWSSRNTPALFGEGMIDAITDKVLLAAEKRKFPAFPEIKGRVSRLSDGRIGRFGWKGQTATLREFVLAACSNELGLEVPGHHQPSLAAPGDHKVGPAKLDLDEVQCNQLIEYVRELRPPVLRPAIEASATLGFPIYVSIGCAACHATSLGGVDGLYSDLLLHDLGDRISDSGGYGGSSPPGGVRDLSDVKEPQTRTSGEAGPTEWRTAPLWGVADSAPYLHDGRASSLDEAIRLHGGEAAATSNRYMDLNRVDRHDLLAFLQSLTAAPKSRKSSKISVRRASLGSKNASLPGR